LKKYRIIEKIDFQLKDIIRTITLTTNKNTLNNYQMAPSKTKKTQVAGMTQQDKAEEINLTNTENLNNEVDDTVSATQEGGKKTKAKKEKKAKEEPKEDASEPETVSADPLEDTPKPKKERKPKVAKEAKEQPKEKKRAPSAYNLFVKEIMPELKKDNEGVAQRDLMKLAAERWNAKKAADAKQ